MRHLLFLPLLLFACTTSSNEVDIPNPFESEYEINNEKTDLNGTSTYRVVNDNFSIISIETECTDLKVCATVDVYVSHDFNQSAAFTKNFNTDPVDLSDVILYPDGKCSVPFSVDSGVIQINKLEDGSFDGSFDVQSREINGYSPNPTIGCAEENYSSQGIRTLNFEGSFTSFISE